jgi:UDP-N-acetylbacillosamine alanyltransferase
VSKINDVYFSNSYASLYCNKDKTLFSFKYSERGNTFENLALKRPILKILNFSIEDGYFDLETPYGYGGYRLNTKNEIFIKKALFAYEEKCLDEKIISEFSRYHPLNTSHVLLSDWLNFKRHDRNVIIVDLRLTKDERWATYRSNLRNTLRRCESVLRIEETTDIDSFLSLYYETMYRNQADQYYFFDKVYFQNLIKLENVRLFNVYSGSNLVSCGIFLFSDIMASYHLSANNKDFLSMSGNYYLLDQLFDIAKSQNCKFFLLGGGRSMDESDSLYLFKKKFSNNIYPFVISGKVFNQNKFEEYNDLWKSNTNKSINFFLKYRLDESNENGSI